MPLDRLPQDLRTGADEDKLTPWEDVTGYNDFYEFGTDKSDPAKYATSFRTRPWKVDVAGEVALALLALRLVKRPARRLQSLALSPEGSTR